MAKRRSRLELMLEVLSIMKGGESKPTRITYAAKLSWTTARKIFNKLMVQGLITEQHIQSERKTKRQYEITWKGLRVLEYFEEAQGFIESLN